MLTSLIWILFNKKLSIETPAVIFYKNAFQGSNLNSKFTSLESKE
jgi:hypothetical protein